MTLDRIRAGDVAALRELLDAVWSPLVRHLTDLLGNADAAKDAAQEAFVRLWERRETWEGTSARALVFRIGRNVALDQRRRAGVRQRWALRQAMEPVPHAPSPEDNRLEQDTVRRVKDAVDHLPPRRREIFELVRLRGLTHQEAGEVLDISTQTVANQITLALKELRAALIDLEPRDAGSSSSTPREANRRSSDE